VTNYILTNNDCVPFPRRTITVTVVGGQPGQITLSARCGQRVGKNAGGNPGVMDLPKIAGHTVIRIEPRNGGLFPDGTIVSLELRTSGAEGGEPDVAMVCDVEVSGLPFRDLVAIDAPGTGEALSVTALKAVKDPHVGPLAKKARAAARAHLGTDRIRDAVHVLVAVDMSVSMVAALEDGSIGAALEIIAGLSQVIDADRVPEVFLLAEKQDRLPTVEIKDVAESAVREIGRRGLGCGFQSTPPELPVPPNSLTYVITDAVPADVTVMAGAHQTRTARHLLVVNGVEDRPTSLPMTLLSAPPPGADVAEHLLKHYGDLSRLVASMLAGVPKAGTEAGR
jgi:hypothetical protein